MFIKLTYYQFSPLGDDYLVNTDNVETIRREHGTVFTILRFKSGASVYVTETPAEIMQLINVTSDAELARALMDTNTFHPTTHSEDPATKEIDDVNELVTKGLRDFLESQDFSKKLVETFELLSKNQITTLEELPEEPTQPLPKPVEAKPSVAVAPVAPPTQAPPGRSNVSPMNKEHNKHPHNRR